MLPLLLACASPKISPSTDDLASDTAQDTASPAETADPGEDTADTADPAETGSPADTDSGVDSGDSGEAIPSTLYERCFADFMSGDYPLPDYDAAGAIVGSHCLGTDHQDIPVPERVVFIGDSITLGTPPAAYEAWYRNVLAQTFVDAYGLEEPSWLWQNVDIINGTALEAISGDFGVCAKWGGRTDDLRQDNTQLEDCLPEEDRDKATLVIITSGGNDVFAAIQDQAEGASEEDIRAAYDDWVALMRDALVWLTEDPKRFPGGLSVIFGNVYEYTDGTGDLSACTGADWVGYGDIDTTFVDELTREAMGEYLQMSVETGTDMLFLREAFCGHGFNAGDPSAPCYRGDAAEEWLDFTCIHPNEAGHAAIADMVLSVIGE